MQEIGGDWRTVLKREFDGEEGTFTSEIRCGKGWDKEAHLQLFRAMIECCKAHEGQGSVERWIAAGFWWLDWYPRQIIERLSEQENLDYYVNAITNFNHLSHWLFNGEGRAEDEFETFTR